MNDEQSNVPEPDVRVLMEPHRVATWLDWSTTPLLIAVDKICALAEKYRVRPLDLVDVFLAPYSANVYGLWLENQAGFSADQTDILKHTALVPRRRAQWAYIQRLWSALGWFPLTERHPDARGPFLGLAVANTGLDRTGMQGTCEYAHTNMQPILRLLSFVSPDRTGPGWHGPPMQWRRCQGGRHWVLLPWQRAAEQWSSPREAEQGSFHAPTPITRRVALLPRATRSDFGGQLSVAMGLPGHTAYLGSEGNKPSPHLLSTWQSRKEKTVEEMVQICDGPRLDWIKVRHLLTDYAC